MANISKINALALANIAKVDAITKANIAKVNGLDLPSGAFTGLLDTYTGAAAAYSTRRLASATTVLLRVRRDTGGGTGDDDEANFKFDTLTDDLTLSSPIDDAGSSSATNLGQFLNATGYTDADSLGSPADGFVDTWTDQSGNSRDAEQTAPGSQPQIFDSSSPTDLIKENGKAAIQAGNYDYMQNSFTSIAQPLTISAVYKTGTVGYSTIFRGSTSSAIGVLTHGSSNSRLDFGTSLNITNNNNAQMHTIALANGSSSLVRIDGSQDVSGNAGTNAFDPAFIMGQTTGNTYIPKMQELIFWGANQSNDFTGIETSVNTHFGIY